jgi:ParB family chromosome partitioning protein
MAKARKGGLGKGLDSLIPQMIPETTNNEVVKEKIVEKPVIKEVVVEKEVIVEKPVEVIVEKEKMMDINLIEPNRDQPRKHFDQDALEELADSIANYGILQPIIVQKKDDYYSIIAGERRWRAAKLARCKEVPVIIREYSDKERMEIALIENIQRENLNPIEEALAYQSLIQEFDLKHEEIAERVSKSRSAITNTMRLLKLDKRVQEMLIDELISMGHARALLALEDGNQQVLIAERIAEKSLSVREAEKLVKEALNPKKETDVKAVPNPAVDAAYQLNENRLKNILGTKVSINRKDESKGKIEISYYSLDELERIIDIIGACEKK